MQASTGLRVDSNTYGSRLQCLVGFNFCPRNFTEADGKLLSIPQHTALFSLYGTTYGGDGRTTFGVPDLRGRVALNVGSGPGLTPYRMGERGGQERVALDTSQLPSHSHTAHLQATQERATKGDPENSLLAGAGTYTEESNPPVPPVSLKSGSVTLDTTGGGQAHENRAPYLVIRACVATRGIFPSRS